MINTDLIMTAMFGIHLGAFMWVALWLRDASLRNLLPLRPGLPRPPL